MSQRSTAKILTLFYPVLPQVVAGVLKVWISQLRGLNQYQGCDHELQRAVINSTEKSGVT